jgi:flagellar basal body-associated protein FliL
MADQAPAEEAIENQENEPKSGFAKLVGIIIVVAVLNAGLVLGGMKFLAAEEPIVEGIDDAEEEEQIEEKRVEILVASVAALNESRRRPWIYDAEIYVVTKESGREAVETSFEENKALIKDSLRSMIAVAKAEDLGHPNLRPIKTRIMAILAPLVEEDSIEEVLISNWMAMPAR